MIKVFILSGCILGIFSISSIAQGTWTQKAPFGGGNVTEARAFAIGNFGYVGGPTPDLWRYDPVTDTWSQMATFIGPTRFSPVAFSIGTNGYIGTGGSYNDFYEYDAIANTWTQKANFGGSGREGALGISIDGKGYIGTGGSYLADWWEYDPITNAWTQKANLAGPTRYHGGAFAIGSKGYVCTGFNGAFFNDLWEYDPALNSWSAKASMPTVTRDRPVGLTTATKGYIVTGWTGGVALNDAWEYDPVSNQWTQLPSMPTAGRYNACGFTINDKLYVGTGYANGVVGDFWEYGPDCSALAVSEAASCASTCDGSAFITTPDPAAIVSYLWSDGQTTPTAINLCAGNYTVAITDTSGCTSVTAFTITEPAPVTAIAAITQPTCNGDTDGELCAIPSTSLVSFLWSTGETTACLQNIGAGVYTVTVTDSTGCSGVVPLTLTEPGLIEFNFSPIDAGCSTCPNGAASAQITGGTPPLSYAWSTGSTLAFVNNLLPGIYTLCVTDANGCSECDSVEIGFVSSIEDAQGYMISIGPNPFTDFIFVHWGNPEINKIQIRITDISGREVFIQTARMNNRIDINTSVLNQGVYFVEISSGGWKRFEKIVKR